MILFSGGLTLSKHTRDTKTITSLYLSIAPKLEILHIISFFKACRRKDEQTLIPCHVGEGLNTTECLKNKCCPSKTGHELKCYMPFKDSKYTSVDYCLIAKCCF